MIELIKYLRNEIEKENLYCEIQSRYEDLLPDVRIEPSWEEWQHDNLGNRKSKIVSFNVTRYIDKSEYLSNLEEGIDFVDSIYHLLKNWHIVDILGCRITTDEVPQQLLVSVNINFTVKIYRRRK